MCPVGDGWKGSAACIDPATVRAKAAESLLPCKCCMCGKDCHHMLCKSAMPLVRAVLEVVGSNGHSRPKAPQRQLLKANSRTLHFPLPPLCALRLGGLSAAVFITSPAHIYMKCTFTKSRTSPDALCRCRLPVAVAGSQVNQSFEVGLPRPSPHHQLSKEDQQGFKTPKLIILE